MADFIVSAVAERAIAILENHVREEIDLVRGVEEEVRNLAEEMRTIRNVLEDAERRKYKDKTVKDWLRRLQDTSHAMDDVLDEWNFAILKHQIEHHVSPRHKVSSSSSFFPSSTSCLGFKKVVTRRDIAIKIKRVKEKLDEILKEKDRYGFVLSQPDDHFGGSERVQSTSFVRVEDICGRDTERDELLSKFLPKDSTSRLQHSDSNTQIVSLVGLGGIGKTALAQMVYNDDRVKSCYPLRIWICVSTPFNQVEIAKAIIEKVEGSCPDTRQLDLLLGSLGKCIAGKKVLLVLDDVWTEECSDWEPLKYCLDSSGEGSTILVTTRSERVADAMGTVKHDRHLIGLLSDNDCWLLLSRIALSGMSARASEKFEEIGRRIAQKCKGLPLAAKAIGSLLHFKHEVEEWQNVLESEIWKLEVAEVHLFPHLFLSYNDLTPVLKHCFSYCAVFPKDHKIKVDSLIRSWSALGYLRESQFIGRECFNNLAMRSLFQEFERDKYNKDVVLTCKMHDLVHDFARYLRKDAGDVGADTTCPRCSPPVISSINKYRSLFLHVEPIPYLCDCLIKLRLLSLRECGLESIPKEIVKLIHLRYLDLYDNKKLSVDDLKIICKLYNLETLILSRCNIQELPNEIGNLIELRHLDLSFGDVKEVPESICNLKKLETLNLDYCVHLHGLPQGIHRLTNLKHLYNEYSSKNHFPSEVVGQLIGLQTLTEFTGKLRHLKNLNRLSQSLHLRVPKLKGVEDVDEAKQAEMGKKVHLQSLLLSFSKDNEEEENVEKEQVWRDVLNALRPHHKLDHLIISEYGGSKLSDWITSSLNQTRKIMLWYLDCLSVLPPLGKLQFLEELTLHHVKGFEFVGGDIFGITAREEVVGFPMLKKLAFGSCQDWKEWEDITAEEEACPALSLFPCLKVLHVRYCPSLGTLPHRLLRKASSLEELNIHASTKLVQHYGKNDQSSCWDSISHIPRIVM